MKTSIQTHYRSIFFLLGVLATPLHALPMDEVEGDLAPKVGAVVMKDSGVTAGARAAAARQEAGVEGAAAMEGAYANDVVSEPATEIGTETTSEAVTDPSTPVDITPEGLAVKLNEARAAQAAWEAKERDIAHSSNISAEEADCLQKNIEYFKANWSQELERYQGVANDLQNKQVGKDALLSQLLDVCQQLVMTLAATKEQLAEKRPNAQGAAARSTGLTMSAVNLTHDPAFRFKYHEALEKTAAEIASEREKMATVQSMRGNPATREIHNRIATDASIIAGMIDTFTSKTLAKKRGENDKTPLLSMMGEDLVHVNEHPRQQAVTWKALVAESLAHAQAHLDAVRKDYDEVKEQFSSYTAEMKGATADAEERVAVRDKTTGELAQAMVNTLGTVPSVAAGHFGPLLIEGGKLTKKGIETLAARWAAQNGKIQVAQAQAKLEYVVEKEKALELMRNNAAALFDGLKAAQASAETAMSGVTTDGHGIPPLLEQQQAKAEVKALERAHADQLCAWADDYLEQVKHAQNRSLINITVAQGYQSFAKSIFSAVTDYPNVLKARDDAAAALNQANRNYAAIKRDHDANHEAFEEAQKEMREKTVFGIQDKTSKEYKKKTALKSEKSSLERTLAEAAAAVAQAKKDLAPLSRQLEEVEMRLSLWNNFRGWHVVNFFQHFVPREEAAVASGMEHDPLARVEAAGVREQIPARVERSRQAVNQPQLRPVMMDLSSLEREAMASARSQEIGSGFAEKAVAKVEERAEAAFGNEARRKKEAAAQAYDDEVSGRGTGAASSNGATKYDSGDDSDEELNKQQETISNMSVKYHYGLAGESLVRSEEATSNYMKNKYSVVDEETSAQERSKQASSLNSEVVSDLLEAVDAKIAAAEHRGLQADKKAYDEGRVASNTSNDLSSLSNLSRENEGERRLMEMRHDEHATTVMVKTWEDANESKHDFEEAFANRKKRVVPKK